MQRIDRNETIMRAAFLRALLVWAAKETRSGPISLPSGMVVDADELRRVVCAVVCAGRERQAA